MTATYPADVREDEDETDPGACLTCAGTGYLGERVDCNGRDSDDEWPCHDCDGSGRA